MNILITEKEYQEYRKLQQEKNELLKYKNAFKELKEHFYKVNTEVDSSCYDVELELIDKLEQKHGIEVE